jgi:hypothetical protein
MHDFGGATSMIDQRFFHHGLVMFVNGDYVTVTDRSPHQRF